MDEENQNLILDTGRCCIHFKPVDDDSSGISSCLCRKQVVQMCSRRKGMVLCLVMVLLKGPTLMIMFKIAHSQYIISVNQREPATGANRQGTSNASTACPIYSMFKHFIF